MTIGKTRELGELCEVVSGITKDAKRTDPEMQEVPYLRVANVQRLRLELTDVRTILASAADIASLALEPGDILLNEGGDRDKLGRGWIWEGQIPLCIHQNHVFRARTKVKDVLPKWIAYFANSDSAQRYFLHSGKQTTNLASISSKRLKALPVPICPLSEQRAVVDAIEAHFSRLEHAVASLKRAKANVKRARASVLKAAVEGRLVPTEAALARAEGREFEPASTLLARILTERRTRWAQRGVKGKYKDPVPPTVEAQIELPSGWTWASVDQVSAEICDGDHQPPPVVETGVPFLVIGDVKSGAPRFENCRFVSEDYYGKLDWKRRPDSHDILYTVVGSLGIPVSIPTDRPFCVQRHIAILKSPAGGLRPYLLCAMGSEFVLRQAVKKATGTAQKTLGLNRLREIVLPIPPIAEQHRIVAEVDRRLSVLDALDATLDANLARCAKLRQSILKRAFEGKLVRPAAPLPAAPQLPLFTEEAAP